MAVIRQGGNPLRGKMMTTTGPKDFSRRGMKCGEKKDDAIFTINANGQAVCGDCMSPKDRRVIRADCEDGVCTCIDREPDDGRLEDASNPDD